MEASPTVHMFLALLSIHPAHPLNTILLAVYSTQNTNHLTIMVSVPSV